MESLGYIRKALRQELKAREGQADTREGQLIVLALQALIASYARHTAPRVRITTKCYRSAFRQYGDAAHGQGFARGVRTADLKWATECALAQAAQRIVARFEGKGILAAQPHLAVLYATHPVVGMRGGYIDGELHYSTPLPIAAFMAWFVGRGISRDDCAAVVDPMAGSGTHSVGIQYIPLVLNEQDSVRYRFLEASLGGYMPRTLNLDPCDKRGLIHAASAGLSLRGAVMAMQPEPLEKPTQFRRTLFRYRSHIAALQTLESLDPKHSPRAAIIMRGSAITGIGDGSFSRYEQAFIDYLNRHYTVTHRITFYSDVYGTQGVGAPFTLLLIDGRTPIKSTCFIATSLYGYTSRLQALAIAIDLSDRAQALQAAVEAQAAPHTTDSPQGRFSANPNFTQPRETMNCIESLYNRLASKQYHKLAERTNALRRDLCQDLALFRAGLEQAHANQSLWYHIAHHDNYQRARAAWLQAIPPVLDCIDALAGTDETKARTQSDQDGAHSKRNKQEDYLARALLMKADPDAKHVRCHTTILDQMLASARQHLSLARRFLTLNAKQSSKEEYKQLEKASIDFNKRENSKPGDHKKYTKDSIYALYILAFSYCLRYKLYLQYNNPDSHSVKLYTIGVKLLEEYVEKYGLLLPAEPVPSAGKSIKAGRSGTTTEKFDKPKAEANDSETDHALETLVRGLLAATFPSKKDRSRIPQTIIDQTLASVRLLLSYMRRFLALTEKPYNKEEFQRLYNDFTRPEIVEKCTSSINNYFYNNMHFSFKEHLKQAAAKEINYEYYDDFKNLVLKFVEKYGSLLPAEPTSVDLPQRSAKTPDTPPSVTAKTPKTMPTETADKTLVHVPIELRLLRRFRAMHNTPLNPHKALKLLRDLQRAIASLEIRKSSKYAAEIESMQDNLIIAVSSPQGTKVEFQEELMDRLDKALMDADESQITRLLKRYARMAGSRDYDKAQRLLLALKALEHKGSREEEVNAAILDLTRFVDNHSSSVGFSKMGLHGADPMPANALAGMQFKHLRLSAPLEGFLGAAEDPCRILIHGLPGSGKSTLAVGIAADIAVQNDAKALIVSAEEGVGYKAQQRIRQHLPAASRTYYATRLPAAGLAAYGVVVIDSATALGLTPEALRSLYAQYPQATFIVVTQSTKQGLSRGSLELEHDADVVVRCAAMRANITKNRYGAHSTAPIDSLLG